jgi:tellurite resistance protein
MVVYDRVMKSITDPPEALPSNVTPLKAGQRTWLNRVPAGLFGLCVGLFAFAGAWRRAEGLGWSYAQAVSLAMGYTAAALLGLLSLLYLLKAVRHFSAVKAEFNHPLGSSLVAMMPLAYLQATAYFASPGQAIWLEIALLALAAHAMMSLRLLPLLTVGGHETLAITPALYLPPLAGALVGSMALAQLGYTGWAAFLFGVGLSAWALLELRILNRLFEGPLPMPMRFTIGLEIAPSAVSVLAATVIWPALPAEVMVVGLGLAAGPVLAVWARYKWWSQAPFSAGFWTFVFPLSAITSVVIVAVHRAGWPHEVAGLALVALTALVVYLSWRTVVLLIKRKLLPPA